MREPAPARAGGHRNGLFAVGVLLSLVSAGYLVVYTYNHWQELPPLRLTWNDGAWLLTGGLLYFASLLTTAGGWLYAVRALGGAMAARVAVGLALASQIGKYAPGNVAHHVGRAALASHRGLSLPVITKASLMEIAIAVLAGGVVAAVGAAISPAARDLAGQLSIDRPHYATLFGLAAVAAVAAAGATAWLRQARRELPWARSELLAGALRMLGCYGLSFLFAGVSFWAVTRAFGQSMDLAFCVAVYALAWVAGFVTPGAPAGLGVRESVLVIATTGTLGPAAVSVAIAHRLVTALADAAGAGVGALVLLPRKAAHHG